MSLKSAVAYFTAYELMIGTALFDQIVNNVEARHSVQLNGDVNYFQRKFVNEVRRCDEMERKLRYIEAEVKKDDVPIPDDLTELPRAPNPREIINLEVSSPF